MTATIRTEGGDIIKSSTPTHKVTPNTVTISREVYAWFKELAETSPRNIPVFVLDEIAKQRGGGQK